MKVEKAFANIELKGRSKVIKKKTLVDTGGVRSLISKRLADELGGFERFEPPRELKTANEGGILRIIGWCRVDVKFQGVEVAGGGMFFVSDNLVEDVDIIIGRPEIDSWDIIFTDKGPRISENPLKYIINPWQPFSGGHTRSHSEYGS